MPGRGSYGPGGKWVYQRAKHIRSKNPDMDESTSFAIATQQAHKVGKSLKSFRTAEGVRTAMSKMRRPVGEYKKTAAPRITLHGKRFLRRAKKVPLRPPTVNEGLSIVEPRLSMDTRDRKHEKTAMLRGLFDELEKISQLPMAPTPAPAPGMGAQSPGAIGNPGSGASGALGGNSGAVAPPPPKPPLVQPPNQGSGGPGGGSAGMGVGG